MSYLIPRHLTKNKFKFRIQDTYVIISNQKDEKEKYNYFLSICDEIYKNEFTDDILKKIYNDGEIDYEHKLPPKIIGFDNPEYRLYQEEIDELFIEHICYCKHDDFYSFPNRVILINTYSKDILNHFNRGKAKNILHFKDNNLYPIDAYYNLNYINWRKPELLLTKNGEITHEITEYFQGEGNGFDYLYM